MARLNPSKLEVIYLPGMTADVLTLPRCYTLTHSDFTGQLFLSIGPDYDKRKISGFYTRLMRDEVLMELDDREGILAFRVYCHVSGTFTFFISKWRYDIFQSELPLVLEAIRYGDHAIFDKHPHLDRIPVYIHFRSINTRYKKVENWGTMSEYTLL